MAKKRDTQSGTGHIKTHRVHKHKSHSRRRYRRSRHYLSESNIDSETGDRSIVFFLHHEEGTQSFLDLASRFSTVQMKYFKQIFYKIFQPESLIKLSQEIIDRAVQKTSQKVKRMSHLLLYLEVYNQILLHFSAKALLNSLQQSLSQYRVRLLKMSVIYKFDFIRMYNAAFMRARILLDQNDVTV